MFVTATVSCVSVMMAVTVTKKEFDKFLARDKHCYHCGLEDETLVPQHRRNRGMGGSKRLNNASNIVVVCSQSNGQFESHSGAAMAAEKYGWKLRAGQESLTTPVFDAFDGVWYLLDDNFGKKEIPPAETEGTP